MNTKVVGEHSESMVLAALVRTKPCVLLPWGDNQRYDLVFEENGKFNRVQCKTGLLAGGAVRFPTRSSYAHRGRSSRGYRGEVDYFGVCCPQTDKVYLVPIDDTAGDRETSLRVDPPRNGQRSNIRWAKAYELSALRHSPGS